MCSSFFWHLCCTGYVKPFLFSSSSIKDSCNICKRERQDAEGLIISWPCFCPAFRHIRQPWDQQNEVTEPGWMMETNLMLFTPAPKGHSNFQQHNQQISEIPFLVELSSRGNSTKMETVSRRERSRPRLNVSYWTFVQRLSLILVPFCHSFDCLRFITMTITIITTALYK